MANDLLPGQIAHVLMLAVPDAALLTWAALRWYERSVSRLMRPSAAPATAPSSLAPFTHDATSTIDDRRVAGLSTAPTSAAPPASFELDIDRASRAPSGVAPSPAARPHLAQDRIAAAYGAGASASALVLTAATLWGGWTATPLAAWFAVWWSNLWPIVPTLSVLLVLSRRVTLGWTLGYLGLGGILIAMVTAANQLLHGRLNSAPLTNVPGLWRLVAVTAALPLLFVAISAWRRVRGIMPIAVASTLVFGIGSLLFQQAIVQGFNISAFRTAILDLSTWSSSETVYYGLFMIASLPVGWICWRVLQRLAHAFRQGRFSDMQLVVDCWWVIILATTTATELVPRFGAAGIVVGALVFVAYRGVAEAVLHRPGTASARTPRLLLLRVFGHQARTEALFDRVAQQWRFLGPVRLIAGTDLAARTADPGDMLALVSGGLEGQYLGRAEQVPGAVAALDDGAAPDGRFRVQELFCRDAAWKDALTALLDASDVVLMDLRSFSEKNSGCLFEIEQLAARVPLERVVLIADRDVPEGGTTDLSLLRSTFAAAWGRHSGAPGRVRLVEVDRQDARDEARVLHALASAAA